MVPGGIKPELVELYKEVGKILRRFTTGKVPKAFKIIPKLENWEDVSILNYLSTVFSTSEASQLAPSWEGENQGYFQKTARLLPVRKDVIRERRPLTPSTFDE